MPQTKLNADKFTAILADYGFAPFSTGRGWVLIVHDAPLSPQMTSEAIPATGEEG